MNLEALISSNAVTTNTEIKSKKRALESLAEQLANVINQSNPSAEEQVDPLEIFQLLIDREKLGSTSMGHGIALPHTRTSLTDKAIGAFLKLDNGIDFDSPDDQATDLIFALVVPEHYTDEHLKILSYLATLFSDETFCTEIRNANNDKIIYDHLTNWKLTSHAS